MSLIFDLFRHEPTFVDVAAGNYLFREGDASKEVMYVLIAGEVNILVGDQVVEEAHFAPLTLNISPLLNDYNYPPRNTFRRRCN